MIVYVGAGSGPFRDAVIEAGHGQMVSRQAGAFRIPRLGRWAFDNGAWIDFMRGRRFDDAEYLRRIDQILAAPEARRPDWCVCPDEVASRTSLLHSLEWRDFLEAKAPGLRWYLALQDGMAPEDVDHALCLVRFDGIFVGGSTPWKIESSPAWVRFGHERGLPVHIARVNGPRRLQWSVDIDADSVDGTGWVRAGAKWLPWLVDVPVPQPRLIEADFPTPEFEAYLRSIWSDPAAWRTRFPAEAEDDWERYDAIAAMGAHEFAAWYSAVYPPGVSPEQAAGMTADDFYQWKMALVHEAERHFGKRPFPPSPPLARFVIGPNGRATPLGQALQEGGILASCAQTGRPMVEKGGCSLPVVAAQDARRAEEVAARETGRPAPPVVRCPPFRPRGRKAP